MPIKSSKKPGNTAIPVDRTLSVAPMMDWTDRHCRYFHRLLSPHALLYTEMVTTGALVHGDVPRHLDYSAEEHPVALQLGGSDPEAMARSAELAEKWGYDEVNINVGCPSDRVQSGAFGACLMAEPQTVADCVAAMKAAVRIPVTVKTRIGIDEMDDYAGLFELTGRIVEAGCDSLAVHARKAWLKGLSPKENRDIPPLNYPRVYQLKADFPALEVVINGGITDSAQVREHLGRCDGVMIGRGAYQNPWWLAQLEREHFDVGFLPERHGVVEAMLPYIESQLQAGAQLKHITRHMLGLFQAIPGAKQWRRHLSERAHLPGAGPELVREAAARVSSERAA